MSARDGCIGQERKGGNEIARRNIKEKKKNIQKNCTQQDNKIYMYVCVCESKNNDLT